MVKHEAFALRRQRERHSPLTDDGQLGERPTPPTITHDQAERHERLRQSAEALARLKPQEIRALQVKAEGYSDREICQLSSWTHTKVNRCLTEGRRALARRLGEIAGGSECAKLEPLLAALADGDTTDDELALLRPHLNTCLVCRARPRSLRAARQATDRDPTAPAPGVNPPRLSREQLRYSGLLFSQFQPLRAPSMWPVNAADLDAARRGDGSALASGGAFFLAPAGWAPQRSPRRSSAPTRARGWDRGVG